MPYYLLLPLGSAFLYALSTLFLKRGLFEGARLRHAAYVTNFAVAIVVCPLYFFQKEPVAWPLIWQPLSMSLLFFVAGWLTVWAMRHGDVSLVTPLMGSKVVFVALGSGLLLGDRLPGLLIVAVGITVAGVFVLGIPDLVRNRPSFGPATLLALLSVAMFAACDLMVKQWAVPFGKHAFIAIASNGVGVISLFDVLLSRLPGRKPYPVSPPKARGWIWTSAVLIAVQAMIVGIVLAATGDATGINVVYATRGLWAILLIAVPGHLFANRERHETGRLYLWRITGSVMLTVAVVLAVISRAA